MICYPRGTPRPDWLILFVFPGWHAGTTLAPSGKSNFLNSVTTVWCTSAENKWILFPGCWESSSPVFPLSSGPQTYLGHDTHRSLLFPAQVDIIILDLTKSKMAVPKFGEIQILDLVSSKIVLPGGIGRRGHWEPSVEPLRAWHNVATYFGNPCHSPITSPWILSYPTGPIFFSHTITQFLQVSR